MTGPTTSTASALADEVLFLPARARPFSRHGLVTGYLRSMLADRPHDCLCTWVPEFTRARRRPAGPSDPRPLVGCWQATGFVLKHRNTACPARWRHG